MALGFRSKILTSPLLSSLGQAAIFQKEIPFCSFHSSSPLNEKTFADLPGPGFLKFLQAGRKYGPHKPFQNYFDWEKEYGSLYKFSLLGIKIVTCSDVSLWEKIFRNDSKFPEPLQILPFLEREKRIKKKNPKHEKMIIALEGQDWKDNRQVLDKPFLVPSQVAKYTSKINTIGDDFIEILDTRINKDGYADQLENLFYSYSTEGIGAVLFDMRVGLLDHKVPQHGEDFLECLSEVFHISSELNLSLPFYMYFPTPGWKRFLKGMERLESLSAEYVKKSEEFHKNTPDDSRLDMMYYMTKVRGQSYERALSNAVALFFAGADSTSNSSLWLLHNLGRFPRVQEKLREEVHRVMGPPSDPRPFTTEALKEMPYLRNTIKESLRLTPTGLGVVRSFPEDFELSGYKIPPKTLVFINNFVASKDEKIFKDPYEFKPERWDRESKKEKPSPWAHLPFGWGPRMCQGMRVSELEMYVLIAKLVQNFEWTSEKEASPYLDLFIRPENPLTVKWKKIE